ncbi:hypothetical protein V2J09_001767 [Rumex salicifolius]
MGRENRRLREPTGGSRDRIEPESSSAPPPPLLPPRLNLPEEGLAEEIPGFARRILGAGDSELPDDDEEPLAPEVAILTGFLYSFFRTQFVGDATQQHEHRLGQSCLGFIIGKPGPFYRTLAYVGAIRSNGTLSRVQFFDFGFAIGKMMNLQTYAALSLFSTLGVIYHAFHSRCQFYPAMVYLSTSKICLVLLLNMGLVIMCGLWQLTKKIFLGSLREAEVERLNEQSWREVMEILFAITIFRQDFSVSFIAMVTALLLIKALHWMAQKRVEYIETTPAVTTMSHIRIVSFMGFLLLIDSLFLYSSLKYLIETRQASVSLFFSFEYMILATTTVATFVKYLFYVCDVLMEGQWERKPVYTFYLELIRDLLHLSMYLCFFMVIFVNYGVPLHLIRELYETFRNFKIRVADYIRYRKITSNMNDRFPDATPEELNVSDATCIICREEMTTAKKLICGHLFHVHCLRSWLERQHTCPTCRAHVVPSETGASSAVGPHAPHTNSQQAASASASGQSSNAGGAADDNMSRDAKLQAAAAAAASIYEKSFVYPAASTLVWSPGYAMLPQSHGQFPDSTTRGPGEEQSQMAGGNMSSPFSQFPHSAFLPNQMLTEADFDNTKKFLEHQIEILQRQLRQLQTTRQDDPSPSLSSQDKGKAVASSSVSDCGSHGEVEEAAAS